MPPNAKLDFFIVDQVARAKHEAELNKSLARLEQKKVQISSDGNRNPELKVLETNIKAIKLRIRDAQRVRIPHKNTPADAPAYFGSFPDYPQLAIFADERKENKGTFPDQRSKRSFAPVFFTESAAQKADKLYNAAEHLLFRERTPKEDRRLEALVMADLRSSSKRNGTYVGDFEGNRVYVQKIMPGYYPYTIQGPRPPEERLRSTIPPIKTVTTGRKATPPIQTVANERKAITRANTVRIDASGNKAADIKTISEKTFALPVEKIEKQYRKFLSDYIILQAQKELRKQGKSEMYIVERTKHQLFTKKDEAQLLEYFSDFLRLKKLRIKKQGHNWIHEDKRTSKPGEKYSGLERRGQRRR
ncbi:MAG: hypothetical protein NUV57_03460 [archaeon]|nr:hypothetical protein [archaeon]